MQITPDVRMLDSLLLRMNICEVSHYGRVVQFHLNAA